MWLLTPGGGQGMALAPSPDLTDLRARPGETGRAPGPEEVTEP